MAALHRQLMPEVWLVSRVLEKLTAGDSCPKQIFCLSFLSWYLCRLFSRLRPPEEVWLKSIWKVLHSYVVPYFSINSFRRVDIRECALWTPGGPKMLSTGLEDQSFPFNTTKDIMSVFFLPFSHQGPEELCTGCVMLFCYLPLHYASEFMCEHLHSSFLSLSYPTQVL